MELTVESEASFAMVWRSPGGLSYHLAFLFGFHHFGLCLTRGCGGDRAVSWARLVQNV